MYSSSDKVRRKLGLSVEDVADDVLEDYIENAQLDTLRDIAIYHRDEELEGDVDGANSTFSTSCLYLADKNFDLTVDKDDVEVYGWTDGDDATTRSSLAVSTIYPSDGIIVLSSAPATTYEKITANYYSFPGYVEMSWVSDACCYLAAYQYAVSEIVLTPSSWMHGSYRFMIGTEWSHLYIDYLAKIDRILQSRSERGSHDVPTLLRAPP